MLHYKNSLNLDVCITDCVSVQYHLSILWIVLLSKAVLSLPGWQKCHGRGHNEQESWSIAQVGEAWSQCWIGSTLWRGEQFKVKMIQRLGGKSQGNSQLLALLWLQLFCYSWSCSCSSALPGQIIGKLYLQGLLAEVRWPCTVRLCAQTIPTTLGGLWGIFCIQ